MRRQHTKKPRNMSQHERNQLSSRRMLSLKTIVEEDENPREVFTKATFNNSSDAAQIDFDGFVRNIRALNLTDEIDELLNDLWL